MTNALFFGDSITYGEYDGVLGGWVDLLKKYCHLKYNQNAKELNVFNLGIGGETTEGLLKRIDIETVARKSPDENLIFISYGANDLAFKDDSQIVSPQKFRENLQSAIKKSKAVTGNIYVVSILPVSKEVDGVQVSSGKLRSNHTVIQYNQIISEVARENMIHFIDTHSKFISDKENLLSKDGVHPNEKGYEMISEIIKPVLDQYL